MFRNVSIAFDGPPVLQDISFSVAPGETRILLGPAGVGKSVLLKLINGLLRPDSGSILLFGEEISSMREEQLFPLRTRTGMVFQEGALFDSLSVRDNVGYQLIQEARPRRRDRPPRSRGAQLRRARRDLRALTRPAFPAECGAASPSPAPSSISPSCILYDSPTGGLDPVTSTTIIELIMKQRDVYRTPRCSSPTACRTPSPSAPTASTPRLGRMVPLPKGETDPNTTFLMLEEGRLIFDGSLHDLVHTDNKFVREFLE